MMSGGYGGVSFFSFKHTRRLEARPYRLSCFRFVYVARFELVIP